MTLKVYGPYKRSDGRSHVIWYDTETKSRTTQSYPRFLMEKHLNRKLEDWEHVDHINEDHTDDGIENLQLRVQSENNIKSVEHRRTLGLLYPEWYDFICPFCKIESRIKYRQYMKNQVWAGKAGPYCSRRCAGKTHN
jgi:hypothetical protein